MHVGMPVFRARDKYGERDDAGMRRGEEKDWTAKEKVDGGDTGGNEDGPVGGTGALGGC